LRSPESGDSNGGDHDNTVHDRCDGQEQKITRANQNAIPSKGDCTGDQTDRKYSQTIACQINDEGISAENRGNGTSTECKTSAQKNARDQRQPVDPASNQRCQLLPTATASFGHERLRGEGQRVKDQCEQNEGTHHDLMSSEYTRTGPAGENGRSGQHDQH